MRGLIRPLLFDRDIYGSFNEGRCKYESIICVRISLVRNCRIMVRDPEKRKGDAKRSECYSGTTSHDATE